jgi:hypothetical protein
MKPIGLTMKHSRNKYRLDQRGELMLIHQCMECKTLSLNRIAADDHSATLLDVFRASLKLDDQLQIACCEDGIAILNEEHMETLYTQLYGQVVNVPALSWS